jgi:ATP-dependent DNA helicase RecG
MAELGTPGSCPRNPLLAAVLHDLNLAEAKGTGIRSMRRLAAEAGLTLPEFQSRREADSFCVTLFLHNLLNEDDHAWLRSLTTEALDADEVKVLIYVRATGAVDNAACRDFSGLDTLTASRVLRRLRDLGLLEKQGSGNATYYTLNTTARPSSQTSWPGVQGSRPGSVAAGSGPERCKLSHAAGPPVLATLPAELATLLATFKGRASAETLRLAIVRLCAWTPLTVEQLAGYLDKDRHYLRNKHLIPMVRDRQLRFRYPESARHPHQAYVAADAEDQNND